MRGTGGIRGTRGSPTAEAKVGPGGPQMARDHPKQARSAPGSQPNWFRARGCTPGPVWTPWPPVFTRLEQGQGMALEFQRTSKWATRSKQVGQSPKSSGSPVQGTPNWTSLVPLAYSHVSGSQLLVGTCRRPFSCSDCAKKWARGTAMGPKHPKMPQIRPKWAPGRPRGRI